MRKKSDSTARNLAPRVLLPEVPAPRVEGSSPRCYVCRPSIRTLGLLCREHREGAAGVKAKRR
jgi:hypothetical protein